MLQQSLSLFSYPLSNVISLQSNAFCIFLFQTRFPEFKIWNAQFIDWDCWSYNLRLPLVMGSSPLTPIGRASIYFLKGASSVLSPPYFFHFGKSFPNFSTFYKLSFICFSSVYFVISLWLPK